MGNGLCVETSSSWTVFDCSNTVHVLLLFYCCVLLLLTSYTFQGDEVQGRQKVLDKVLGSVGSYAGLGKLRNDDDFIDRLSHHYTTMLLVIFTIVVSTKQYVGDAIQCWCPAQFTDAHVHYANQICWVSNTYHVPVENIIPADPDTRRETQLTYYQWVPFILLFMAMLFKLPRITWKVLTYSSSISIDKVLGLIYALQLSPKAERDEKLSELTDYLDSWLQTSEQYRDVCCLQIKQKISQYSCFVCGRRYGNHFITSAIFVKFLYFTNAFMQYFALNAFLGKDFAAWGFEILTGLADENPDYMKQSPRFPRVTLCDFQIRQMMNVQRWTVQCVLPINLFNSKIFLFIWFWLVFLCVTSLMSLCTNFYATMFHLKRVDFIRKYLTLRHVISYRGEGERRLVHRFVMSYLRFDGFYVLRVAARNATDILTAQIIENLYRKFKERRIESKGLNGGEYV